MTNWNTEGGKVGEHSQAVGSMFLNHAYGVAGDAIDYAQARCHQDIWLASITTVIDTGVTLETVYDEL